MPTATATTRLLNPAVYDAAEFDPATQRLLRATIDWFEAKGKARLTAETRSDDWYADFIEFLARERAFATLLTPGARRRRRPRQALGHRAQRGLQRDPRLLRAALLVRVAGHDPRARADLAERQRRRPRGAPRSCSRTARCSPSASPSATTAPTSTRPTWSSRPTARAASRASGGKYYIGNGNVAGMVSVFGRRADVEGPEGYVFFAADSPHPAYKLIANVVHGQMYVSAFDLEDYPVRAEDVLHTGVEAFEAALNTINVGKFNLGFCAIGMAEHCFYETVTQAEDRVLFGKRVTEFGQVRRILSEAYARLLAAKLYGARAVDYVRSASREDRRYLLYTPINKMQVTTEGERIVRLLAEVISAKGFERD